MNILTGSEHMVSCTVNGLYLQHEVIKVPGGWIFTPLRYDNEAGATAAGGGVFVPEVIEEVTP